jgi:hypothetical protein
MCPISGYKLPRDSVGIEHRNVTCGWDRWQLYFKIRKMSVLESDWEQGHKTQNTNLSPSVLTILSQYSLVHSHPVSLYPTQIQPPTIFFHEHSACISYCSNLNYLVNLHLLDWPNDNSSPFPLHSSFTCHNCDFPLPSSFLGTEQPLCYIKNTHLIHS